MGESGATSDVQQTTTVCLIRALRVPGRHSKLVRATVRSTFEAGSLVLFEPDSDLNQQGLCMTEAATEPRSDQSVTLIIENESTQPVWLKKGQVLGRVEPASLVDWPEESDTPIEDELEENPGGVEVRTIAMGDTSQQLERGEQLLSALKFEEVAQNLMGEEAHQLKELVLEFADVFTLKDEQPSGTDLVTHSVDTADHQPIKQPPRRLPFALRKTICPQENHLPSGKQFALRKTMHEMVEAMLS